MRNRNTAPEYKRQMQDRKFQAQMSKVFEAFLSQPKTMLMVSVETGVLRANICRYIAHWEKHNRIEAVKKGICPLTKHRAGFYTTNPELFNANTNDQ